MRILVVGAGALGGYFGGRLLQAGRDVTFLVRERRAAQLSQGELVIRSPKGDAHIASPPVLLASQLREPFDLILLSCKAYDLESAMQSFAPAVGSGTAIIPVLNGMGHLDALAARFGRHSVLGGVALISSTLDAEGRIVHLNELHKLTCGELDGRRSARIGDIEAAFASAGFEGRTSNEIVLEMWEKWVGIASLAGITCLMRASIGDIGIAGGHDLALQLYEECAQIATAAGYAPRPAARELSRKMLTIPHSKLSASMLRDIQTGNRTEVDQILGDLLARRPAGSPGLSLLATACIHVKAYEAGRLSA